MREHVRFEDIDPKITYLPFDLMLHVDSLYGLDIELVLMELKRSHLGDMVVLKVTFADVMSWRIYNLSTSVMKRGWLAPYEDPQDPLGIKAMIQQEMNGSSG